MVLLLRGGQGFGLSLDFIQPAVQLPLVTGRRLRLRSVCAGGLIILAVAGAALGLVSVGLRAAL